MKIVFKDFFTQRVNFCGLNQSKNWLERGEVLDCLVLPVLAVFEPAHKIRKNFKNHEKESSHKALYMANCIEFNLSYSAEEEHIFFQNELLMAKHSHGKDKEKDDEICVQSA